MRIFPRLLLAVAFALALSGRWALGADIYVAANAPEPVRFGAAEVARAIKALGEGARLNPEKPGEPPVYEVFLGASDDARAWKAASDLGVKAKPGAEGFSIRALDGGRGRHVAVVGGDAVGAMYGALELAERISLAGKRWRVADVTTDQKPYLEVRATNPFIFSQALDDETSWFYNRDFWKGYLELHARSRYNLIDIHAAFDLHTTYFPNIYPYFTFVPEFPDVGVGAKRAAKNVAMLNWIIEFAASRGVKVALMNYNAATFRNPGKEQAGRQLNGPETTDYVYRACRQFLENVKGLWMFGFRIGESGQRESFFGDTYLKALRDTGSTMNVYTRSWLATRSKILPITEGHKGAFYIEPKYNGEHLGLPYQAITSPKSYAPSYSYEDYTEYPRNYKILYQVRACGTHRVWHWGNRDFARRMVESCRLGDGAGFTMEPLTAYYPLEDVYLRDPETKYFTWAFERDWFWYELWGRTGYDPALSGDLWKKRFEARYGAAGPALLATLEEGSKIIPLLYSYHCLGPDHRNHAPEFESGNNVRNDLRGRRVADGLERFIRVIPLDTVSMADIRSWVAARLEGRSEPRFGPLDFAREMDAIVARTRDLRSKVKQTERAQSASDRHARHVLVDMDLACHMGAYYAEKVRAATSLEFFNRTQNLDDLIAAEEAMDRAIGHFEQLALLGDAFYNPLLETLRMKTRQFTWTGELKDRVYRDRFELQAREAEFAGKFESARDPLLGHRPEPQRTVGEARLTLTAPRGGKAPAEAFLLWRRLGSGGDDATWREVKMAAGERFSFAADLPKEAAGQFGAVEYYFRVERYGRAATLPAEGPAAPFVTRFVPEREAPVIGPSQAKGGKGDREAEVRVKVTDGSRLAGVTLHYKLLPSKAIWRRKEMAAVRDGVYGTTAPLTRSGLQYYFTAVDEHGNAAQAPDFRAETPYKVIESWEEAGAPVADTPAEQEAGEGF
ncbi:MAG: hypothetical protein HY719_13615 [Planctomycetes bacterium]|nr:hypothetical protein [Planctomycetota bacterium]